jgi:hypothetical protein
VNDEMNNLAQRLALLEVEPRQALTEMQERLQRKYDAFVEKQRKRKASQR